MIKPVPKNQDGKIYQNMQDKASFVLVRRKGKIHGCYIRDNKLLRLTTDEENGRLEGMICIAKVMDIVPNINAAFLRIAGERKCFIKLEDLRSGANLTRPGKAFAQGDNVLVQITKEPSKGKEASATCDIRMEGCFVVASLGKTDLLFSHKINENRRKMLENKLNSAGFIPIEGVRLIVRTQASGEDVSIADIIKEANNLSIKLKELLVKASHRSDYSILEPVTPKYQSFITAMYPEECAKILTDDKEIYEEIKAFIHESCPEWTDKIHLYEDCLVSLNVLYGLESKLSEAVSDKVWLKCGGFLYIEPTQALTVIDVNSGKYDKKSNKEDTYFYVNMEAAEEIALQIFLRNLTGIIVVDFINMEKKEHREELINTLTKRLQNDTNPARVLGYTKLGLIEITRKKTDKSIYEQILV